MQLFNDADEELNSAVDFDALDSPGRIDWHLFRERTRQQLQRCLLSARASHCNFVAI